MKYLKWQRAGLAFLLAHGSTGVAAETTTSTSAQTAWDSWLIAKFTDACINGKASFKRDEATSQAPGAIPLAIRSWYGSVARISYYKINADAPSYLVTFIGKDRPEKYPGGCALITKSMSLDALWVAITHDDHVPRESRSVSRRAMPRPKEGYIVSVTNIDSGFVVAQVTMLNDKQKSDMIADDARRRAEYDRKVAREKMRSEREQQRSR